MPGKRGQPVVGNVARAQQQAGEHSRIDHRPRRPGDPALGGGGGQEADVERGVVRDDDAAAGEVEERRKHLGDCWRLADHGVGDSREFGDVSGDRPAGIHQRRELGRRPARAEPDGSDLGNARRVSEPACRLDIDDDQVSGRQERPAGKQAGQHAAVLAVSGAAFRPEVVLVRTGLREPGLREPDIQELAIGELAIGGPAIGAPASRMAGQRLMSLYRCPHKDTLWPGTDTGLT